MFLEFLEKSTIRHPATLELPSVAEENFAPSFSLKFLRIFVHILRSIDSWRDLFLLQNLRGPSPNAYHCLNPSRIRFRGLANRN